MPFLSLKACYKAQGKNKHSLDCGSRTCKSAITKPGTERYIGAERNVEGVYVINKVCSYLYLVNG
jgi:hypothetical protein